MSIGTQPQWLSEVNQALTDLDWSAPLLARVSGRQRAALARACLGALNSSADEWTRITTAAKGLDEDSPWRGEERVIGPMAVARYLRLIAASLEAVAESGAPRLPGPAAVDAEGRVRVPVLPTKGLFDGVAFKGFRAHVVMQPGIEKRDLGSHLAASLAPPEPGVALVLGAGNVSSIAAVDALDQVLHHGRATLVKLHPHFSSLRDSMARALAPLVERGFLRVVAGDAEIGAYAAADDRVTLVAVTGSSSTFARIVWGDEGEMESRRSSGRPVLKKPVLAELGSVTPWIVVPGEWSDRELQFQAENLAGSIVSNGSFNCVCPKVIVTSSNWPQRERFLELLRTAVATVPPRHAFYRGAIQTYVELVGEPAGAGAGRLPWTILFDVDPDERPELFERENLTTVTAETCLDEQDAAVFLDAATRFVNERVAGTLAVTVVVSPQQRRKPELAAAVRRAERDLRYGTVCINQFAGLAYLMMSTPWGAFPGATLDAPESGTGFVHNTYMLEGIEKTVFEGPFRITPKPLWFPSNRNAPAIAGALTDLYLHPSARRVPRLLVAAMRA
jgi:acyl-CoA reductase-like NAD-dependent aldehyde dehydrogenase